MTTDTSTRETLVDRRSRRDGVVTLEGRLPLADAPGSEDDAGPLPGERIGRYVLLHRVGAGGMGVVFAAQDPELDRIVALKVLTGAQRSRGPAGRARFVREAQAMARLTHPNVVEIYDVGTSGDAVFIAMELVDGQTLKRWLEAQPRPWREVVHTFVAAGRGLAAAHEQAIVHRDFKPDNVLLSIDRSTEAITGVRVVDFGLARGTSSLDSPFSADPLTSSRVPASESADEELARPLGLTQLTGDGTVMGTPGYMAPEQHRGRPIDPRADLGSTLQRLGRNAEAEAVTREGLAIRQQVLGEEHPEVARSYTNLGAIDGALGDFARAEAHYGRAAEIFAAVMGEDNATTAAAQVNHAFALERAGDPNRALELLRSAGARLQTLLPADHPHHAFVHLGLARTHLALDATDVALHRAERALELCRVGDVEPIACAQAEFQRARALWPDASRQAEALADARAARTALKASGDLGSPEFAEVEAWLREHEG